MPYRAALVWTLSLCTALWAATALAGVESSQAWRQRLESMSAAEREELIRKKERFEKLKPQEQDRLRQLHEQISSDPQADRLKQVMVNYCDWLKTLSSTQRAELAGLSAEERISKVKEFLKLQEEQRFKRLVTAPLPQAEFDKILAWREDYMARNEKTLIATLHPDAQRWIREERDPARRLRRLGMTLGRQAGAHSAAALAKNEEFTRLVGQLNSPEALKALEAAKEPEQKKQLVQEWLKAAVIARMNPPVSNEELQRFYAENLDSVKREELELLPREKMQEELRRLYNLHRVRRPNEPPRPSFVPPGPGGPGRRGPGPAPRGEPG